MSLLQVGATETSANGYNIDRSLRFRQGVVANLTRTPAANGSRTTMTFSCWHKRGILGSVYQDLFSSNASAGSGDEIGFRQENLYMQTGSGGGTLQTTPLYRDFSSWYHIVFVFDTTNATSTDRLRLYVNGVRITTFTSVTYPALNGIVSNFNTTTQQMIGAGYNANGGSMDGYLAEINFIDGQALTAASFGETDTTTGAWKPKKYTGTYGTNGYYLNFSDNSALTTTTNVGLGKDFSGNANRWTTNNISITAGATYDSMTDVPTITSATVANYATFNPLDIGSSVTLSAGNLAMQVPISTSNGVARSGIGMSSGKWYWEVTPTNLGGTDPTNSMCGVILFSSANSSYLGSTATGYGYYGNNGQKYNNGASTAYGATYTSTDTIGVAFDADAGTLIFYKNNTSQGTAFTGLTSGVYFAAIGNINSSTFVNFGQQGLKYTPPSGYVRLNAYNLPTSTIVQGNKYMDATLYTGNLTGQSITNAASFKPDLVWIKSRSAATDNKLTDFVRGTTKALISNTTGAETTDLTGVTAFNTNGFTVGASTVYNNTGATYVGWQWAGSGATVSNTSGSITSTVDANTTAGFSIVTYTGTGANATVGHGLGAAPKMIIIKSRSIVQDWQVYHASLGNTSYLQLDTTGVSAANINRWNNTSPTSSVFTIGTAASLNTSAATFVAYCWAEIAGFSKFGSYTGNGSTDGTFVYTGFRPKFIMIKTYSGTANQWFIFDSAKNPYNVTNSTLFANTNGAESGAAFANIDILSNGFKCRTIDNGLNSSGLGLIYAAFAENPFKYSLAR
jgi:hypothetical protein